VGDLFKADNRPAAFPGCRKFIGQQLQFVIVQIVDQRADELLDFSRFTHSAS
jgi:hypothetical protein